MQTNENELLLLNDEKRHFRFKLIELVHAKEFLWNNRNNFFSNRNLKDRSWREISARLGQQPDKIRRTWENLRNQYRRDLKRQLRYGIQPKWRFFNDMNFLRSMVRVKENLTGNSESETDEEDALIEEVTTAAHTNRLSPPLTVSATDRYNDESPSFQILNIATEWRGNSTELRREQQQQQQHPNEPYDYVKQQQQQQQEQKRQLQKNECNSSDDEVHVNGMTDLVKIEIDTDSSDHQQPEHILAYSSRQKQSTELHRDQDAHHHSTASVSEHCVSTSAAAAASSTSPSSSVKRKRHQQQNERSSSKVEPQQRSRIMSSSYAIQSSHDDHNVTPAADDDDYHFVMSILPSLREISRNRKFPLRMSIMNLITKELNADE